MKKIKVGVIGAGRGMSMMSYCKASDNAELVAICDKYLPILEKAKEKLGEESITYYTDYDEFLKHDMDAVVLANYANEHAPFAIKAMEAGFDVMSEVLPCQNMKEAVELVEAVEKTGKKYCYLENYCYMPAPYEMKRLFREGKIGEFRYGECEYVHNCETIWPEITYGEEDHWRNNMYSTFYCTHSIGPIVHITGLRPVSVTGFELPYTEQSFRIGLKGASPGIEMLTLENGAMVKSIHGHLYRNNIWYFVSGSKGAMESERNITRNGEIARIHVSYDENEGDYAPEVPISYNPLKNDYRRARPFGHGGSDYYAMYNAIEYIAGNDGDIIDVYEALDMYLPGLFAYFSVLAGGVPMNIPNLRDKSVRDEYRNDTRCTDPKVAGDMLLPCNKNGNPDIPQAVYDKMRDKWMEKMNG